MGNQNVWWQNQQQPHQTPSTTAASLQQQPMRTPPHGQYQHTLMDNFAYSAKHAGLYLYLGRLLRPLWKKKCVIQPQCQSSIRPIDCTEILEELHALKSFLDGLPDKNLSGFLHNNSIMGNGFGHINPAASQQNAYAEEKQSVNALLYLISEFMLLHGRIFS